MASIDSSAPETTSSDNSPTMERRNLFHRHGPGSDSGSSGKSSDSLGSSMSGAGGGGGVLDKMAAKLRDDDSPAPYDARFNVPLMMTLSRSSTPGNMKVARCVCFKFSLIQPQHATAICRHVCLLLLCCDVSAMLRVASHRYKGKKSGVMPTVPNQPSEATAHFMFELAKTVLMKAGGSSSTALFTHPTQNNNPTGPHRNLHLCAFQVGLYALGLHNCVSPNWLSRTYSSHVSWITGTCTRVTVESTGVSSWACLFKGFGLTNSCMFMYMYIVEVYLIIPTYMYTHCKYWLTECADDVTHKKYYNCNLRLFMQVI